MFRGAALALFFDDAFGLSAWLAATGIDEPVVDLCATLVLIFHSDFAILMFRLEIDGDKFLAILTIGIARNLSASIPS